MFYRARRRSGILAIITIFFSLACSSLTLLYAQTLPGLPRLALENFGPAIREQVRKAYTDAQTNPRNAGAQGRLGMVLQAYEQYEHAEICYERARLLEPGAFQWVYYSGTVRAALGKHSEAAATFREALRLRPDYLPARIKLAESLLASGELSESQQLYESVLKKDPDSVWSHYGLGRIKAARRDLTAAVEHFRRACDLSKHFGAAHYALALAYRDLGQTSKANEHFSLYQKNKLVRPRFGDSLLDAVAELNIGAVEHLKKGANFEAAGQLEEAITEHIRALEINPQLVQVHTNLISLYGRRGQMEKAEQHYRESLRINPNQAESHYNFGVLLAGQNRYAEAAAAFRRSLEINPFYAEAHHNYGSMLEREGRLDEAMQSYRAAIENRPNYRLAHYHLGRILVHRGKMTEAINHFLQTLTPEDESTPTFMYALAAAYARSGNRQSAIKYAQKARQRAATLGQTELLALIERDLRTLEQTVERQEK